MPGLLHIVYQESGAPLRMMQERETPSEYRIVDPRTGRVTATGRLRPGEVIAADRHGEPRVVIFEAPRLSTAR